MVNKAPAKQPNKSGPKLVAKSVAKPEPAVKADAATAAPQPLPETAPSPAEKPEPKTVNLGSELVQRAITEGGALIKSGKSKADAARAIYDLLKDEDKAVIVAAFIQGATLTEKGALTYWYNCKRKMKAPPT